MVTYVERLSRLPRQRSSAAVWCQRLAVFALPYLMLVVLGHRFGLVETIPTFWLLALGILILIAALVAGARGFYELWTYGAEGGLSSARGVALAVILLVPFLFQAVKAVYLPPLYDISTDLDEPPAFATALDDRIGAHNQIVEPNDITKEAQLQAYPQVAARRYPLEAGRVFIAVGNLITEQGWTILTSATTQGEAQIDEEGSGLVAKPVIGSDGLPLRPSIPTRRPPQYTLSTEGSEPTAFETVQVSPTGRDTNESSEESEERYIEAVATSLLFGFESDVVIRLIEEEDGTLVDMRSVSRFGPHDLGSNASRILNFMRELDTALQGLGLDG